MYDYIIVGSGFSGSVIAERIANVLNKKVLVIDKRKQIGGNCYDYIDGNGIIVHKYGPHLFHTDDKEVFEYLSNFTDWHIYEHRVLAYVDGKKIPIPFNFNSMDIVFEKKMSERLQKKLIERYGDNRKVAILELKREEDKDIKDVAEFIYEKIFKNYTIKQWGVKPEYIDSEVTARVPVYIGRDDRYFNDIYQAVPRYGYTKIFERMLGNKNIKLILNMDYKDLVEIDFDSKKIYFNGEEFKGKLVYTGMVDELFKCKFGKLPYRTLDLKFETIDKEYFQEVATVNYPNDYDFTRITEFKHIHPVKTNKTTILKEYPRDMREEEIPYYPFFTKESRSAYNKYKELAEKFDNIILLGRLAEYRYYDMDDTVKNALKIFEEKIWKIK